MFPSRLLASTLVRLFVGAVALTALVVQAEPSANDVKELHTKLDEARTALASQKGQIDETDRALLLARLADAESALKHYVELAERGSTRTKVNASLSAAGTAVVADDVTGVGTADDVLLPALLLGALVTNLATKAPATTSELDAAWASALSKAQALAQAAAAVKTKRKGPCSCACYKQGVGPGIKGQKPSPSVCWDVCKEDGYTGYRCGSGGVVWMQ